MNTPRAATTGVIFDLDGTLADTLDDLADALNRALVELGYAALDAASIRAMIGDGMPALVSRAAGTDDADEIERVTASFRKAYEKRMLDQTRLYAGVPQMLDRLREAGVGMSVLSNKSHEFTVPMGVALLSRWPIQRVQGVEAQELKKPNPTVALEMAAGIGVAPADMFFVGDSEVDIETGRSAGMTTIAVAWGFRSEPDLRRAHPDHLVFAPAEVADIVLS